jgi:antitoxin (DNA-binding transcriptional repressor) of toxin-antitoxin stability system
MKTLNVHEAKTNLAALLIEVEEKGESFLICRNGNPVADLVPHVKKTRLTPHPALRKIILQYDATEPLTSEEWPPEESQ